MAANSSLVVHRGAIPDSAFNGHTNPSQSGAVSTTPATSSGCNGMGNPVSLQALKHDPGLAVEWSVEEQAALDDGLSKFANESNIFMYIKIAALLPEKTVRDVALRCRWMSKKENGKRRKIDEQNAAKKIKDRKEKIADSSVKQAVNLATRSCVLPGPSPLSMENANVISYEEIGGTTGHLLKQNAEFFSQITANLAAYKIRENVHLLCRTRDNIAAILNDMRDMPVMSQMPPLPVKVSEGLAGQILPTPPQTIVLDSSAMHLKQELR